MIGNLFCWAIALCLLFPNFQRITNDRIQMLFAMGFIFLGTLSKAVSVYRDTHTIEVNLNTDENGNLIIEE